jgi:hypothetical protein
VYGKKKDYRKVKERCLEGYRRFAPATELEGGSRVVRGLREGQWDGRGSS